MSQDYKNCCGRCFFCDLDDKSLGKFYCRAKRTYVRADESSIGCRDYKEEYRLNSDIDKARERIK